jgi:outer membrane protein TolC
MKRQKIIIAFLLILNISYVNAQTLDYFIKQGLANSPLLKDYQNQINSSVLDSMLVKSSKLPQVNLNGQLMVAPEYKNFGYDDAITNGGNYSGLVSISQPVFNKKIQGNKYERISIQKLMIANTSKISTNDLIRAITNQYLTTYLDFSDLQFNDGFFKLIQSELDIIQKLVLQGIYKQTDYLSLLIESQSLEILIRQLNGQYKKDIRLLNQLCGLKDTVIYNLTIPKIDKKELSNQMISPLFMQYTIDSFQIKNEIKSVENRYRPKIIWYADAGFNSSKFSGIYQHFGYSAGINLSIPIYDGNQRKYETEKLSISEDSRYHYEVFYKNQYTIQVKQLISELTVSNEVTDKLKKKLTTAEELLSLSKKELYYGNISITEFLNSLKNYNATNHDLSQSQIKTLIIVNELNYLMQQ